MPLDEALLPTCSNCNLTFTTSVFNQLCKWKKVNRIDMIPYIIKPEKLTELSYRPRGCVSAVAMHTEAPLVEK